MFKKWAMFFGGRYIMDVLFYEIEQAIQRESETVWQSLDGQYRYYNFEGMDKCHQ